MPDKPKKPKIGMWIDTPDFLTTRIKLSAIFSSLEEAIEEGYTEKVFCKCPYPIFKQQTAQNWSSFAAIYIPLNTTQSKVLAQIQTTPIPKDIPWFKIESLLIALGCTIDYRGGSKLEIAKGNRSILEHRPHNTKHTPPETIKRIKTFLQTTGVIA